MRILTLDFGHSQPDGTPVAAGCPVLLRYGMELWANDLSGYYDPTDSDYYVGMRLEVWPVNDGLSWTVYEVRSLGRMEGRYRLLMVEEA